MSIETLRKALKDNVEGLAALETKALADGATETDVADLDTATKNIDDLEKKIASLEKSEAARAKYAKPAAATIQVDDEDDLPEPKVKKDLTYDEKFGLVVQAMYKAEVEEGHSGHRQTMKAIEDLGYSRFAKSFDMGKKKSLNSGNASQGGVLLPENMASEIIPLLYPNTTFLQASPRRIPMPNGTYKQPKGATGASAAYRGEGAAMAVSQATFSEIDMSAKLLAGITTITDQLLRWSLPDAAAFAREDISVAMGTTMDSAMYFGSGTAYTPLGLLNKVGIFSTPATNSIAPTYTQIDSDAKKLELSMINANLPMTGAAWVMAPRVLMYMRDLRDANGNKVYPTLEGASPTFRGRSVFATTQFPINGGGATDESTIALIAFGHIMYGDSMAMQMKITRDATIVNGGTTINTWQQGVMGLAVEWEHDVGSRYLEAVAKLTAVRWGA